MLISLILYTHTTPIYFFNIYVNQRCEPSSYGAPLSTIFGDELSVRCWIVGAMFPPSIFESVRRSKIDAKIDGRRSMQRSMVDGRRSMVDGRRSKIDGRPSKIDGR